MAVVLTIGGINQTAYLKWRSMTLKINTVDLSLVDPVIVPAVGDAMTLSGGPDWPGTVTSVAITDIVEKGPHILVDVVCTNEIVPGPADAPFDLSDDPSFSDSYPYKNLMTKTVINLDGTQETKGSCTIFVEGLWPGETFELTSENHGYAAEPFIVSQVIMIWPQLEANPEFRIEFGDANTTLGSLLPSPAPSCDVVAGTDAYVTVLNDNTSGVWPGSYPNTNNCGTLFHNGSSSMSTTGITVTPGLGYDVVLLIDANKHSYTPSVSFYTAASALISTLPFPLGVLGTDHGVECVIRHCSFTPPPTTDYIKFNFNGKLGGWHYQAHLDLITPGSDPIPDVDPLCLVAGPGDSPYYMKTDDPRLVDLISQVAELADQIGLNWKRPVRAATTVAGTLASSFENGDTIDGVVLATGDRILLKDQAAGAENGIYTVNVSGAPTRAEDADTDSDIEGSAIFVSEGTVSGNLMWVCTTNAPIVIGTTALVFGTMGSSALGIWTSFTPTLTATTTNPTLGSSTLVGRYKQLDSKTYAIQIRYDVVTGGAYNAGSGSYIFALPAGLTSGAVGQALAGFIDDASANKYNLTGYLPASQSTITRSYYTQGILGHNTPVVWATGDSITLTGLIEVA